MACGLEVGFLLDRQWHWLRGEMEQTKRPTLLPLARILAEAQVPYAFAAELNAAERALLDGLPR